jgi:hypothetical protein
MASDRYPEIHGPILLSGLNQHAKILHAHLMQQLLTVVICRAARLDSQSTHCLHRLFYFACCSKLVQQTCCDAMYLYLLIHRRNGALSKGDQTILCSEHHVHSSEPHPLLISSRRELQV